MKSILKHFIINTTCLYIINQFISGLSFTDGVNTLVITGGVVTLANFIVKPVINLLLLPINLITFGVFKWVAYAITLYLVTLVVPGFEILGFNFPGYYSTLFNLPKIVLSGGLATIAFSFVISTFSSIIYWLMK